MAGTEIITRSKTQKCSSNKNIVRFDRKRSRKASLASLSVTTTTASSLASSIESPKEKRQQTRIKKESQTKVEDVFEAVDIQWAYSESAIGIEKFSKDIYCSWRIAEVELGVSREFLKLQALGVNEQIRRSIITNLLFWRNNFNLTHETLHLAIYIFDKCLDSFLMSQSLLKDVAAVALVLASKLEEYRPLKFSNVIGLSLTNSPIKFLSALEKRVLYEINYKLSYPTPFMFLNYFHNNIQSSLYIVQMSNYILELSLLSSRYRDFGGAFTAHAVVCLSCALISYQFWPVKALEDAEIDLLSFSRIPIGSTRKIMRYLAEDFIKSSIEKEVLYSEYSSVERCSVSCYEIPKEIITFLNLMPKVQ